jgi:hypothetical protein
MKTLIGLLFIICFIIIGRLKVENNAIRSDLNDLINQSDTIYHLKSEIYYRDSILLNCDEFLPNAKDKDVVTLKKFYFNR